MYRIKPELVSFQAPAETEGGQEQEEPHFDMAFAWLLHGQRQELQAVTQEKPLSGDMLPHVKS